MIPAGAEPLQEPARRRFHLTVTEEGVYGVKCTPHYAMGMVALIQVGAPVNAAEAEAVTHRGKAGAVMTGLFGDLQ